MIDNQRIAPNLRRKTVNQQEGKAVQAGFTLVELLVVIGILGILMTIASGSWSGLRSDEQVRAAAGKIHSAMVAARIKALTSGETQYVGIDMVTNTVATVVYGQSVYDSVTKTWAATSAWEPAPGANFSDSTSTGLNPAKPNTTIKTFQFQSTGEARDVAGVTFSKSVRVNALDVSSAFAALLVVNGVVGRVRLKECVVVNAGTGECK